MKRIYILIPSIESARAVVRTLKKVGVQSGDMHVIIKDRDKLEMSQIPEAGILHTSDFFHSLIQGSIVGGIAGMIAGLLAINFPPEGLELGSGTVVGLCIFGIVFGAWASSLVGISIPNPVVLKFKQAVEAGGIMMLVDIEKDKEEEILEKVKKHHPEVTVHGIELPT